MPRRIKVNKKLLSIVSEIFFLDEEEVTLELTPDDVETWDSLNHLILVTAVEKEFGIKLSMKDIESISNLDKLNRLVEEGS
ncbi:MAG: acyl carrier protein [Marinobacter sp.]|nr:acyl carrier protein [Marinobacter sp.]